MLTVIAVLLFGVAGQSLLAQGPDSSTMTGRMTTPRAAHTATLLLNGKVLIAGGAGVSAFNVPLASAELYDPVTGTFTATGMMTTAREQHTATLLADGRVLIAGGRSVSNGAFLTSAELYDPSTGTFTATTGRTSVTAGWGTATLLANGKVLLSGVPAAEIYDPVTATFTAAGAYAGGSPRFVMTSTLLPDNRVLLTGGTNVGWTELYDPGTDTFSLAGRMNGWGNVNTATLLTNGKILFVGNDENDGFPAEAELYDSATGIFTRIDNAGAGHEFAAAALLPDGAVLITGGQIPGGNGDVVSELYEPAVGAFTAARNLITARHEHTATLLPDGTVLIAGGYSNWPFPTSTAEIYHPAVLTPAPTLFSLSGDRQGQGAILHAGTTQVASSSNPAVAGEALEIYLTGLVDGSIIPPQVAIGGQAAEILFFGKAPGFAGLNQVNARVPSGLPPGTAVPVRLSYLGRSSNQVTIGVQ